MLFANDQTFLRIQRMLSGIDADIGADYYIIANFNSSTVTDKQVMIKIAILTYFGKHP